jgi:hypothetical protein
MLNPFFSPEVYLGESGARRTTLTRDAHGPRAVVNALERLGGGYRPQIDTARHDLAIAESQLKDYESRLGLAFQQGDYLAKLTDLRDRLRAALSGLASDTEKQDQPNTADLAAEIKTLRGEHGIEAPGERTAARRVTAEEPVSAKIRRRAGIGAEGGPTNPVTKARDGRSLSTDAPGNEGGHASSSFRDRVETSRRERHDEPGFETSIA